MSVFLRFCIALFWFSLSANCMAQQDGDSKLLLSHNFADSTLIQKRQVKFGISSSENVFVNYNPVSLLFSGLMFTYQKWISPQISADCLYSPSCSEYSRLLFKQYGFFKGLVTSADRLMRCDRISATTINPVSVNEKDGKVHESVLRYRIRSNQTK